MEVRGLVADYADVGGDTDPLELDSLSMVQLGEDLEARFDFVMRAEDLTPEVFGSVSAVADYVARARAR